MKTVAGQFAETLAAAGLKRIYGIVGDKAPREVPGE
jgi:thiamine pyrophosphate-dependent acetolactate synthase large subunit-like protein